MLLTIVKFILRVFIVLFVIIFIFEFLGNFKFFEKTGVYKWYLETKEKCINLSSIIIKPVFNLAESWADWCYEKIVGIFRKEMTSNI